MVVLYGGFKESSQLNYSQPKTVKKIFRIQFPVRGAKARGQFTAPFPSILLNSNFVHKTDNSSARAFIFLYFREMDIQD